MEATVKLLVALALLAAIVALVSACALPRAARTDARPIPPIDAEAPARFETATFAFG